MNRLLPSGGSRRGNCGHREPAEVGAPLAHVWPTFVRTATAWHVVQRRRDGFW
jgi:hypothetical protein